MHRPARLAAHLLAVAWLIGCSSTLTMPAHDDIDRARRDWLERAVRDYTFEISSASSWFPASGYVRVQVANGEVVSAVGPDGKPLTGYVITVDWIWDRILAARAKGEVNSVLFSARGVPIETDLGPWPVDGGTHYSVRNFEPAR